MAQLHAFFARGDYRVAGDREARFQRAIAIVFRMLRLKTLVEKATSDGRIDMEVETPGHIYRFKMMRDRPARGAMAQIEAKRHAARYARDGWGRVSSWA